MGCISWALVGLLVGTLAKFLMPGKDPGGFFVTILLGIGGAALGGYLGTMLGFGSFQGFDLRSLGLALGGTLLLLIAYRLLFGEPEGKKKTKKQQKD